jgi:dihydroflavonol-4-reductase
LDACAGQIGRFMFVSSVGVFGNPGRLGVDETHRRSPSDGKVGYHTSKAKAEDLVFSRKQDMEVVIVRPTITYGPGDLDGMLTRLIMMRANGRFIRVGRGSNHFHLTYIDDLVDGLVLAGVHPKAAGEAFILAGRESIQVRELVGLVEAVLGFKTGNLYIPETLARLAAALMEKIYRVALSMQIPLSASGPIITGDKIDTICVHRGFSSEKAQKLLGYQPRVEYQEGLEKTISWMVSKGMLRTSGNKQATVSAGQKMAR